METLISIRNLDEWLNNWAPPEEVSRYLIPLISIQECEKAIYEYQKKKKPSLWIWDSKEIQTKWLVIINDIIWKMTGDWNARRNAKVDKEKFCKALTREIKNLTRIFNENKISCMWDIGKLFSDDYEKYKKYKKIVSAISGAVYKVSKTKQTENVQPTIGSKALHHIFPSIIPVYDQANISKKVLKISEFKKFIEDDHKRKKKWIIKVSKNRDKMQEYHDYLTFCIFQISSTKFDYLNNVRESLMQLLQDLAPKRLVDKKEKDILGKLDAKIAEYCLTGYCYNKKKKKKKNY